MQNNYPENKQWQTILEGCKKGSARHQRELYDQFAPTMYAVCRRYLRGQMEAEDALLKAFKKVFDHIDSFEGKGSLHNWIKKIVINETLMVIRRQYKMNEDTSLEEAGEIYQLPENTLEAEALMQLIQELPMGFRTVFNLYAIEGYHHHKIAKMLNISENTSKSQLNKVKKILQKRIREEEGIPVKTGNDTHLNAIKTKTNLRARKIPIVRKR